MSCVEADRGRPRALLVRWGVLAVLALLVLVAHDGNCLGVPGQVASAAASAEDGDGHGSCHADRADPAARVQARHLGSPLPHVTAAPADVAPILVGPGSVVLARPLHRAAAWVSGSELLAALGVART